MKNRGEVNFPQADGEILKINVRLKKKLLICQPKNKQNISKMRFKREWVRQLIRRAYEFWI